MPIKHIPFDCAKPLREWIDDPSRSVVNRMSSLVNAYSDAYRQAVAEIRRLEAASSDQQPRLQQLQDSEYSEIQAIIDASIADLDPDRK